MLTHVAQFGHRIADRVRAKGTGFARIVLASESTDRLFPLQFKRSFAINLVMRARAIVECNVGLSNPALGADTSITLLTPLRL